MKNRILVVIWFICMALAALCTGEYLYVGILAVSGVVLVLSGIYCLLSGKHIKSTIKLPRVTEKDRVFQGKLKLENQSVWPVFYGKGEVTCKNTFTGEEKVIQLPFSLMGRKESQSTFEGMSQWCGCLHFSFEKWKAGDFLHVFYKKRKADAGADIVVMPARQMMDLSLLTREGFDMESFRYSAFRPGDDPGETYDIREYRPGDSIRQIHWKLSGKLDSTVIREKSFPVDDAVLVLAEPYQNEKDPQSAEAVVEVFAALLQSFMERKIPCQAAVYDGRNGRLHIEKIHSAEAYENIMYLFLRYGGGSQGAQTVREYMKTPETKSFANYIYITGEPEDHEERYLKQKGLVTTLRCGQAPERSADEIVFTKENYHQELGMRNIDGVMDFTETGKTK